MNNYLLAEIVTLVVLYATAYALGVWVGRSNVKVNYTRKIFHFVLFFTPVFLATHLPYDRSLTTFIGSGLMFMVFAATLTAPVRQNIRFLAVSFRAIDRPEDRPFTLFWLTTQVAATYAVALGLIAGLFEVGKPELIFLPVVVNGIGDGLAEPIGVRFGRHRYRVGALFSTRRYTRSIEGSACVFLSAVAAVILLEESFTGPQLIAAMVLIPVAMTLAEAVSPHTWDSPLLYGVAGIALFLVLSV